MCSIRSAARRNQDGVAVPVFSLLRYYARGHACAKAASAPRQDTVYFIKGACQEELVMQGRGKDAQVWLDSFDAVTPCIVQEVRSALYGHLALDMTHP